MGEVVQSTCSTKVSSGFLSRVRVASGVIGGLFRIFTNFIEHFAMNTTRRVVRGVDMGAATNYHLCNVIVSIRFRVQTSFLFLHYGGRRGLLQKSIGRIAVMYELINFSTIRGG